MKYPIATLLLKTPEVELNAIGLIYLNTDTQIAYLFGGASYGTSHYTQNAITKRLSNARIQSGTCVEVVDGSLSVDDEALFCKFDIHRAPPNVVHSRFLLKFRVPLSLILSLRSPF